MSVSGFYSRVCRILAAAFSAGAERKKALHSWMDYAGIRDGQELWLGKRVLLSLLSGIIGFVAPYTIGKSFGISELGNAAVLSIGTFHWVFYITTLFYSLLLALAFTLCAAALFYLHAFSRIESRASNAEAVLPDFLMLVASNINAGMTPFAAFRNAARDEFGALSEEIRVAATKSLGTGSFTEALGELSSKIRSPMLGETVSFFGQGLRSGGHLSKLLESSASDIRHTQEMRKELLSSTRMYVIFVMFVVVIATPLLLGVSVQFLKMISAIQAQAQFGASTATVSFLSAGIGITPEFMVLAAYILLVVNAFLSSAFIGVLDRGKAKLGLKYAPLILLASVVVFTISSAFLERFLGV
ncbi:MAG TPA: type II secretion system F family protein [archaeon]|nr:type II secretion system F family protein [archaeon]